MPIIHRCAQGSREWQGLRLGIPTASNFHRIITPRRMELSEQRHAYLARLVYERLTGEAIEDDLERIEWIDRGQQMEPHAARDFQKIMKVELDHVGFITDDKGLIGCSPDALVVGRSEGVEIKCPKPETQMARLLSGLDDKTSDKYRPQVQGQLYIAELARMHYWSWHENTPPFHIPTGRDEQFIGRLQWCLTAFLAELDIATAAARRMGMYRRPRGGMQIGEPTGSGGPQDAASSFRGAV